MSTSAACHENDVKDLDLEQLSVPSHSAFSIVPGPHRMPSTSPRSFISSRLFPAHWMGDQVVMSVKAFVRQHRRKLAAALDVHTADL